MSPGTKRRGAGEAELRKGLSLSAVQCGTVLQYNARHKNTMTAAKDRVPRRGPPRAFSEARKGSFKLVPRYEQP